MSDQTSSDPRRRQISRELRNDIESGRLKPGDRMPSNRSLATQWGVGTGTVNAALEELIADGLVISRPRSGRVVAPRAAAVEMKQPKPVRPRAIYVGGYAGSGKTEVGRTLARETGWAMLDKDTLTRSVVEAALTQLGVSPADRESATYLDVIRPAEYQCLESAVAENISCGVSTIATAPYLREFTSKMWFERTSASLESLGADMSVLWIRCSPSSMWSYITRRGAARDGWKLAHWEQYLAGVDERFEPPWPHTIISNDATDEPIQTQVRQFLQSLGAA